MTNNDTLRRLRYAFDLGDSRMIAIFGLGGLTVTRAEVCDLLARDLTPEFKECSDPQLAAFLNGLIVDRRGPRDGAQPAPEQQLSNNLVLTKLKIALAWKSDDVMESLNLAGFKLSKHELSALFRRPDNRHYRECQDQLLRNFLKGLQIKLRGEPGEEAETETETMTETKTD